MRRTISARERCDSTFVQAPGPYARYGVFLGSTALVARIGGTAMPQSGPGVTRRQVLASAERVQRLCEEGYGASPIRSDLFGCVNL